MRASYDLRADLTLLTTNKMSGGQQLFGSNNLVIAGREQENRASYYRKINRASECCETPSCKLIVFVEPLNDLEIIGAGEIDGARVPFAKERDQPQAARRSDIIRNLQQAVNCFGFERWMFPDLQQMRAADAPVPELYQLFEHRSRHAMGHPRQLGFACIDVDRCPCENESAYLAGIPRGIDKRHPAALTDPYQIGAAAETRAARGQQQRGGISRDRGCAGPPPNVPWSGGDKEDVHAETSRTSDPQP
jgi:hypothetical protein